MFRIDVPTAAVALPTAAAPGSGGYFTNGNPGLSIASTVVDQDWLNSVQEELVAIATALGATLSKTTRNQCLTAIQSMIQQQTGNFATDSGALNAYVGVYAPAITAYTNGMVLRLYAGTTNTTTTPTFDAGAGALTILRDDGSAIVAGDIPAGSFASFEYRSATTKWYLLSVTQNVAAAAIQAQTPNYAAAGGTANAITATYTPAIGAHITGAPLRVKIATTNTGAVTFNPGPGAIAVKAMDGSALVAGELIAGAIHTFMYDGASYLCATLARTFAVPGAIGLTVTNDATTPNTKIAVTADLAVLVDSIGRSFTVQSINFSTAGTGAINLGVTGANGLDTGAQAASTWYHAFIIAKADGTKAGLASLSATAPTLPTGYIYFLRVGAMRSGGATTLLRTKQVGSRARYVVTAGSNVTLLPSMVSVASSQTRTGIAYAAFIPPTATQIAVVIGSESGPSGSLIIAPSNDAGYSSTSAGLVANPPPAATFGGGGSSIEVGSICVELTLEDATNIYYSSAAGAATHSTINAYGWTDKVNAA